MITKNTPEHLSSDFELDKILDHKHGLYQMANILNWEYLIESYGEYYVENKGRPGVPIRVIAGLHYLKYLENESDESIIEKFPENPYWQYFCGFKTFQHKFPCHPSSLSKWRKRIGDEGVEKLLKQVIDTAKFEGLLPEKLLKKIIVDTTVQEKSITFPTDAKLLNKMREHLVLASQERDINLRQTYIRVGKQAVLMQQKYSHCRKHKLAKRQVKKLKTYLGRVMRDIERKVDNKDLELTEMLKLAERLLNQQKKDKNKLYSLHAPEVECISKGKAHKKYEFGCKISVTTTAKDYWIVSIFAEHGNPYDGHTLCKAVEDTTSNTGIRPEEAYVDKGYRGKKNHPDDVQVFISGQKHGVTRRIKKLLKSRSAIEPIISHLKHDHRMFKNYLLGKVGDKINAILSACAFNLRKMMRLIKERNLVANCV